MTQDRFLQVALALLAAGAALWIVGELNRYGARVPWWCTLGCIMTSTGGGLLLGLGLGALVDGWLSP